MSGTPAPAFVVAALGGIAGRAAGAAGFACGAFATFFEVGAGFVLGLRTLGAGFFTEALVSFFLGAVLFGFERYLDLRVATPVRFFWFSARWLRTGMDWFNSFLAMARKDS
jgi:hypothetical protein